MMTPIGIRVRTMSAFAIDLPGAVAVDRFTVIAQVLTKIR